MIEHPIEGLMVTAMNSIQDMVDVNTIIGEPIHADNNIVIIPISKVSFGFAAGGSEFSGETLDAYNKKDKEEQINYRLPFGGGSGAGVAINPVAFLVINNNNVKLMPVNHSSAIDKLLDYVPDLFEKTSNIMNKCLADKKEKTSELLKQMKETEKDIKENILKKDAKKEKVKKISIEKNIKKPGKTNLEYEFQYDKNGEDEYELEIEDE
ncbi:MAG: GerW family sporulation protein [Clostridia bacterium]|nr:GerW family sporulation protein [Clostridia bacterium]